MYKSRAIFFGLIFGNKRSTYTRVNTVMECPVVYSTAKYCTMYSLSINVVPSCKMFVSASSSLKACACTTYCIRTFKIKKLFLAQWQDVKPLKQQRPVKKRKDNTLMRDMHGVY